MTMERNVLEAERALVEKPLMATSVERVQVFDELKSQYKELPQPLRFAKFLEILLERVSVPVEDWDLIAGRSVERELTPEEEAAFQSLLRHPDYPMRDVFLDYGHCAYSWDLVVELGLPGLERKAREKLAGCTDTDERNFLTAVLQIQEAIRNYILRYAAAARSKNMPELAENLEKAATQKPDSFAAALQLLWIITLIGSSYVTSNPTLTLGRLDQILYPLYEADIRRGVLSREKAEAYITDYYCKNNLNMGRGEHQVGDKSNSTTFQRIFNFDAPQYLLLAGTDETGADAANDLTLLFARCIRPKFKNPVVVVYFTQDMDTRHPQLWDVLTGKARKSSSLIFYNDADVLETYRRIGLPEKDYRHYIHFGCNWPSPGDNAAFMEAGPNSAKFHASLSEEEAKKLVPYKRSNCEGSWPEDFMIVLRTLAERDGEADIEDFYRLFFERMGDFMDQRLQSLSRELAARKRRPSAVLTFADCFLRDSLENAQCISACAKYHFELQPFQMFGTVADCFIAVDQLVMREKKLTLKMLLEAVDANFEGYPQVLAWCRGADKYGMDTELSNAHVKRLAETAGQMAIDKSRPYLEKENLFLAPCMQSDTWHLKRGEKFGATPDGRLAHTAFSQNIAPALGTCSNGLTAMLRSVSGLPKGYLLSGALNLDIDPKQFEGKPELFSALLAVYLNQGGLQAQVSCVGAEELLDAQKRPWLHRDIRVRVTGYSGVFVDICKRLQDDIIRRFGEEPAV